MLKAMLKLVVATNLNNHLKRNHKASLFNIDTRFPWIRPWVDLIRPVEFKK